MYACMCVYVHVHAQGHKACHQCCTFIILTLTSHHPSTVDEAQYWPTCVSTLQHLIEHLGSCGSIVQTLISETITHMDVYVHAHVKYFLV